MTRELGLARELLPCPFCGKSPHSATLSDGMAAAPMIRISCAGTDCPIKPSIGYMRTEACVAAWNRRAKDAARLEANERRYFRLREMHNNMKHFVDGVMVSEGPMPDDKFDACIDALIADADQLAQEAIDAALAPSSTGSKESQ
jgi:hypothetical protein